MSKAETAKSQSLRKSVSTETSVAAACSARSGTSIHCTYFTQSDTVPGAAGSVTTGVAMFATVEKFDVVVA